MAVENNAVTITSTPTRGDAHLHEYGKKAQAFSEDLARFRQDNSKITEAVGSEDLTGKQAEVKRKELSESLRRSLTSRLEELDAKEGEIIRYSHDVLNPTDPEAERKAKISNIALQGVSQALRKMNEYGNDSPVISSDDRLQASLFMLNEKLGEQIEQSRRTEAAIRRSDLRQSLMTCKGGTVSTSQGDNISSSNRLGAEAFRLHLYQKALAEGDEVAIGVFEDPLNEDTFFSGDSKVLGKFLTLKMQAEKGSPNSTSKCNEGSSYFDWFSEAQAFSGPVVD